MGKSCAVPTCKTGHKSVKEKRSLFKVPSNAEQYRKWKAAIPGIVHLRQSQFICERHFEKRYILRKWVKHDSDRRVIAEVPYAHCKLDLSAVPSVFDSETIAQHCSDRSARDVFVPTDSWINVVAEHSYCSYNEPSSIQPIDSIIVKSLDDEEHTDTSMAHLSAAAKPSSMDFSAIQAVDDQIKESLSVHDVRADATPVMDAENTCIKLQTTKLPPIITGGLECIKKERVEDHPGAPPTPKVPPRNFYISQATISEYVITDATSVMDAGNTCIKLQTTKLPPMITASLECIKKERVEDRPGAPPTPKVPPRNFYISQATISECTGDEKYSVTISKSWGIEEFVMDNGHWLLFSHSAKKLENGILLPATERSVTLGADKKLRYYIYGRAVDVQKSSLVQILDGIKMLPESLNTFRNMSLCNGLGNINVQHLSADSVFTDCVGRTHHKDCTLISKRKRCDHCMKKRQAVQKKEARFNRNGTLARINKASNPIDQRKLIALRKKSARERRIKMRAQNSVQLLAQSLRDKESEIALIRAEMLTKSARD